MIDGGGKLTEVWMQERGGTRAQDGTVCVPSRTSGTLRAFDPSPTWQSTKQQVSQPRRWGFPVSSGPSWCFVTGSFLFSSGQGLQGCRVS